MRNANGSDWVQELERLDVVVSDANAFGDALATTTDPATVRAVVKVYLDDKLPDTLDQTVAALVQTAEIWKQAFAALWQEGRSDPLVKLLCATYRRQQAEG